jgi:hypothetical protein
MVALVPMSGDAVPGTMLSFLLGADSPDSTANTNR